MKDSTVMHSPPHPLQACWDLALAAVKADALDAALALEVFDHLQTMHTAASLAHQLGLSPANTGHWLELLWSMGLLARQPGADDAGWRYVVTAALRPYLTAGSSHDCRHALRYRLHTLREFGAQLPAWLSCGDTQPVASASAWAQAAQSHLAQEQEAATVAAARACIDPLPGLHGTRRFLDLGGGPGRVAIALAQAYPDWRGQVFDLPDTVAVAAQGIAAAGLQAQLGVRGGDLACDSIGDGYDLIWCSSVLHFVPDLTAALDKICAALAPGGYLVCVHAERPDSAEAAVAVLPYYLPLLMRGRQVWAQGALEHLLPAHGLTVIDTPLLRQFPLAPAQAVIARKSLS